MTDWREVVEQHGHVVWQTAYRLLGNHADASVCFQRVFLDAVCDLRAKKWLTLIPGQKMAIVLKMENAPEDRPVDGSFELIRQRVRKAQADPDEGSRPFGEKLLDGVGAVGFRLEDKTGFTDVWVDPKTSLPIRVETTFQGEMKVEVVMSNFQFDVELDESLFSFDPPSDYTVREMGLSLSPPSIEDLVDMLRFGAENDGSVFPEEISGAKGVQLVMGKLLQEVEAKHGQDSPEWKTALVEYSSKIARGSSRPTSSVQIGHYVERNENHHAQQHGCDLSIAKLVPEEKARACCYRTNDGPAQNQTAKRRSGAGVQCHIAVKGDFLLGWGRGSVRVDLIVRQHFHFLLLATQQTARVALLFLIPRQEYTFGGQFARKVRF